MAEVTLPQLGETVTEGTITQWFKQVGDTVAADEPLFEVSTDKVDTEVPSPVAGTLTEIRVPGGRDGRRRHRHRRRRRRRRRAAGAPRRRQPRRRPPRRRRRRRRRPPRRRPSPSRAAATEAPAAETAGRASPSRPTATAEEPAAAEPAAEPDAASRRPPPAAPSAKGVLLSPVVRRLVNEHGLDPAAITGTGPGGRITRDDVLDHIDKVGARAGRRPPTRSSRSPADEAAAPPTADAGAGREGGPGRAAARRRPSRRPRRRSPAGQRDETIPLTKIRKLTGRTW